MASMPTSTSATTISIPGPLAPVGSQPVPAFQLSPQRATGGATTPNYYRGTVVAPASPTGDGAFPPGDVPEASAAAALHSQASVHGATEAGAVVATGENLPDAAEVEVVVSGARGSSEDSGNDFAASTTPAPEGSAEMGQTPASASGSASHPISSPAHPSPPAGDLLAGAGYAEPLLPSPLTASQSGHLVSGGGGNTVANMTAGSPSSGSPESSPTASTPVQHSPGLSPVAAPSSSSPSGTTAGPLVPVRHPGGQQQQAFGAGGSGSSSSASSSAVQLNRFGQTTAAGTISPPTWNSDDLVSAEKVKKWLYQNLNLGRVAHTGGATQHVPAVIQKWHGDIFDRPRGNNFLVGRQEGVMLKGWEWSKLIYEKPFYVLHDEHISKIVDPQFGNGIGMQQSSSSSNSGTYSRPTLLSNPLQDLQRASQLLVAVEAIRSGARAFQPAFGGRKNDAAEGLNYILNGAAAAGARVIEREGDDILLLYKVQGPFPFHSGRVSSRLLGLVNGQLTDFTFEDFRDILEEEKAQWNEWRGDSIRAHREMLKAEWNQKAASAAGGAGQKYDDDQDLATACEYPELLRFFLRVLWVKWEQTLDGVLPEDEETARVRVDVEKSFVLVADRATFYVTDLLREHYRMLEHSKGDEWKKSKLRAFFIPFSDIDSGVGSSYLSSPVVNDWLLDFVQHPGTASTPPEQRNKPHRDPLEAIVRKQVYRNVAVALQEEGPRARGYFGVDLHGDEPFCLTPPWHFGRGKELLAQARWQGSKFLAKLTFRNNYDLEPEELNDPSRPEFPSYDHSPLQYALDRARIACGTVLNTYAREGRRRKKEAEGQVSSPDFDPSRIIQTGYAIVRRMGEESRRLANESDVGFLPPDAGTDDEDGGIKTQRQEESSSSKQPMEQDWKISVGSTLLGFVRGNGNRWASEDEGDPDDETEVGGPVLLGTGTATPSRGDTGIRGASKKQLFKIRFPKVVDPARPRLDKHVSLLKNIPLYKDWILFDVHWNSWQGEGGVEKGCLSLQFRGVERPCGGKKVQDDPYLREGSRFGKYKRPSDKECSLNVVDINLRFYYDRVGRANNPAPHQQEALLREDEKATESLQNLLVGSHKSVWHFTRHVSISACERVAASPMIDKTNSMVPRVDDILRSVTGPDVAFESKYYNSAYGELPAPWTPSQGAQESDLGEEQALGEAGGSSSSSSDRKNIFTLSKNNGAPAAALHATQPGHVDKVDPPLLWTSVTFGREIMFKQDPQPTDFESPGLKRRKERKNSVSSTGSDSPVRRLASGTDPPGEDLEDVHRMLGSGQGSTAPGMKT
ncbi:unnamed protein product [Amoebophrya sp. A120]|nr:unnamed protein product [Amoebophrya sp. A120]|eukprot:GSA120T00007954001.1